jgi:16S rRNA (uracil1498-N3)-methyltransferase
VGKALQRRQVFVEGTPLPGTPWRIEGQDYVHLSVSLRMRAGETLLLVDPQGRRFAGKISALDRRAVSVEVEEELERLPKLRPIQLALCMPSAEAMDAALDAATQLGVTEFQVLSSAHSQKLPTGKAGRWERAMRQSCCQSFRAETMAILEPQSLDAFLKAERPGTKLLAWQGGGPMPASAKQGPLSLLIGPEGGFDEAELDLARAQGWQAWSLGPGILRVPVAVAAALGALQTAGKP